MMRLIVCCSLLPDSHNIIPDTVASLFCYVPRICLPQCGPADCDTSVEDDWKACPKCGELLDSEALATAVREASSGAGSAGAGGSEALEAQPVSIDDLLASLDEEDGLPEGEEEEPGEDSGAAGDTNGDVMDELKKKLEELDE